MSDFTISAVPRVTETDLAGARLGQRFGRLDLACQLAVLVAEPLAVHFDAFPRERIGICLEVRAGSLSTDVEYWNGRDAAGGLSPTLFTYTLPSAAIGELAIRHRLTGPNLCFVGNGSTVLPEAADWLRRGEVEGCLCVACDCLTPAAAAMIETEPVASACALFLRRGGEGRPWRENDRDMKALCATVRA
jgi:3-oxoacyl-(acyl-carrier-protein) synthase